MDHLRWILFEIVGIFGISMAVAVNLAPMRTFWNIMHSRTLAGDVSGLRHVAALGSAVMWVSYPVVNQNVGAQLVILISNAIGGAIQIFYLTVFLTYAQRDKRRSVIRLLAVLLLFVALVGVMTLEVVPRNLRHYCVGGICVIFGIVACACPLSRTRKAASTGSWESLPIDEYWLLLINGIIWTWFGVIIGDRFVTVPNLFGLAIGLVLLSRYYWNRRGGAENGTVVNSSSLDHLDGEPVKGAGNSKPPSSPPSAPPCEASALPV